MPSSDLLSDAVPSLPRGQREGDQLVVSGILLFACLEDGPDACLFLVMTFKGKVTVRAAVHHQLHQHSQMQFPFIAWTVYAHLPYLHPNSSVGNASYFASRLRNWEA